MRWERVAIAVALLLLAAYAAPLFLPPAPRPPILLSPEQPVWIRIFPGVPGSWVAVRLVTLTAAALLMAWLTPRPVPTDASRKEAALVLEPGRGARITALGLAMLGVAMAIGASALPRWGQLLYLVLLAAPSAALWLGARAPRGRTPELRAALLAVVGLTVLWAAWRGAVAWYSLRPADAVDTWLAFERLASAGYDGRNLLSGSATDIPGVKETYLLLQGVSFIGPGRLAARVEWVLLLHVAWLSLAALGVGWLAARWVAPLAAPVATAAFLFSPFALFIPLSPSPIFVGPVLAAGLGVAFTVWASRGSPAALVAFGALAGFSLGIPPVAPLAGLMIVGVGWRMLRRSRPSPWTLGIGVLAFVAAVLPSIPGPEALTRMAEHFVARNGSWSGLEWMVMGQSSPRWTQALWRSGGAAPLDLPLGVVLSPFAIPRTPLRLWGDALFDPLGAALAGVGIAVCLRHVRRDPCSVGLLVLLGASLLPGVLSSFDRPSHTRMFTLPVTLALVTAVGFEAFRRHVAARRHGALTVAVTVVIAAGGILLFDVVSPRILPRSAPGLVLETLRAGPPSDGAVLLDHPPRYHAEWLHLPRIASLLPDALRVRAWEGPGTLEEATRDGTALAIFWSPGLEVDEHITAEVCRRWPGAVLFEITGPPGFSRALAATARKEVWTPSLSPRRWRAGDCGEAAP